MPYKNNFSHCSLCLGYGFEFVGFDGEIERVGIHGLFDLNLNIATLQDALLYTTRVLGLRQLVPCGESITNVSTADALIGEMNISTGQHTETGQNRPGSRANGTRARSTSERILMGSRKLVYTTHTFRLYYRADSPRQFFTVLPDEQTCVMHQ